MGGGSVHDDDWVMCKTANKVSVCFVKEAHVAVQGSSSVQISFCIVFHYFIFPGSQRPRKTQKWCTRGVANAHAKHPTGVYETPNLNVFLKAFSDIAN